MMRRLTLVIFALFLAGCDLAQEEFQPQVVVEAFLVAGEPLPLVRLSQTAPISAVYEPERYAVTGAEVRIVLLDAAGEPELTVRYEPVPESPGYYDYVPAQHQSVQPGRGYRLEAEIPAELGLVPPGALVTSETVVPDTFLVVRPLPDTVRYNLLAPPPSLDVTPSEHPDRQAIYVFTVEALDPERYGLTPTYADLIDQAGEEDFRRTASPPTGESAFERNPDGTFRLSIPWFTIAYFGPNRFTINALDDNVYDFLRSRTAQFVPTTLSPGEIPDVLTRVENGVGVFGSLARQQVEVFVEE